MPMYTYKCVSCTKKVVVERHIKDWQIPPPTCSHCGGSVFLRHIDAPSYIGKKDKGYFNSQSKPITPKEDSE